MTLKSIWRAFPWPLATLRRSGRYVGPLVVGSLGSALLSAAHAQECFDSCQTAYESCAAVSAAGCDLAAKGAQQVADQALSNLPYGGLAASLIGASAKNACNEKLAPCNARLEECKAACTEAAAFHTNQAAAAAAMSNLIVYSDTPGATIYIDGQRAGVTSEDSRSPFQSPPLLTGAHTLRLEKSSGTRKVFWEGGVVLEPGKINSVETGNLHTGAYWKNQEGEALLLAGKALASISLFAGALQEESADFSDRSQSENGLIRAIPTTIEGYLEQLDQETSPRDQWLATTWAPGVSINVDYSSAEQMLTLLETIQAESDSRSVQDVCTDGIGMLASRFESEAHSTWMAVEDLEKDRYAQYGAAIAWLKAFPGALDTDDANRTVHEIDELYQQYIQPLVQGNGGATQGSDIAAARARRDVGSTVAVKYAGIKRLGMQGFIDAELSKAEIWVEPQYRQSEAALWAAEQNRRPNRGLRGLGYAAAWTAIPVGMLGAMFGWDSEIITMTGAVGIAGGGALLLSTPLQAHNLKVQYGTSYPTNGPWGDSGLGFYALAGVSIAGMYMSKTVVEARAVNSPDFGGPVHYANNLNMLRTMGIAFGAMGVGSTVLRHTGIGGGASKGKRMSVRLTPTGLQGSF